MVEEGDEKATLIWNAMLYQTAKAIGEMACVLEGKVDAILLTGGLVRYDDIVEYIKAHCGWIAPIALYPGEVEQEAMAWAVLDVVRGKKEAIHYNPHDVFDKFDWDDVVY